MGFLGFAFWKRKELAVDTRNLNFVDRPEDFEELIHQLAQPLKGTRYYVPRGAA